jgi:hypothetical protein
MIKARLPYSYVRTGCVGGAPTRERVGERTGEAPRRGSQLTPVLLRIRVQGSLFGFNLGDGYCNQGQGGAIVGHLLQASEAALCPKACTCRTYVPTQFRGGPTLPVAHY